VTIHARRLLLIAAAGIMSVFVAQLISRNFYLAASVDYAHVTAATDSLSRTRQALVSRIAVLESPPRLREAGEALGLQPMPVESFMLMEAP
jgi:hypothetical protein